MRDITLFTMPRHFVENFKIIQYNAIKSWLALDPTPEVILCGNDEGVAEAAKELGVIHIPDIEISKDTKSPLISSVFDKSRAIARNDILVCINADVILMNDFLDTLDGVALNFHHKFMIVGQRWDMEILEYIDFQYSWEEKLREEVIKNGVLHPTCGIDYFVFEKDIVIDMLPFPVGRGCWDNWFMAQALHIGLDVVDATEKIFAVHQNHRRFHLEEYKNNRTGKESKLCTKLAQGKMGFISHANWKYLNGKLVKQIFRR